MAFAHAGRYGADNFVTTLGTPIPAGTDVYVYDTGTVDLATLYSDRDRTPLANPFPAANIGNVAFYAEPELYDVSVNGGTVTVTVIPDTEDLESGGGGGVTPADLEAVARLVGSGAFVYDSSGPQGGNRFNTWTDLIDALADADGDKSIQFLQDETVPLAGMPVGGWNLSRGVLTGTGTFATGCILTFPDGVKLDFAGLPTDLAHQGITLYSLSTDPVVTIPSTKSIYLHDDALVASAFAPFFSVETAEFVLFSFRTGSGLVYPSAIGIGVDDYESVDVADAGASVIFADAYGASNLQDDTIRGIGAGTRVVMAPVDTFVVTGDTQTNLASWTVFLAAAGTRIRHNEGANPLVTGDNLQAAFDSLQWADTAYTDLSGDSWPIALDLTAEKRPNAWVDVPAGPGTLTITLGDPALYAARVIRISGTANPGDEFTVAFADADISNPFNLPDATGSLYLCYPNGALIGTRWAAQRVIVPGDQLGDSYQIRYDDTGNTHVTGDDVEEALNSIETNWPSGAPSGGAGGVLSGNYPNPGFAVDMVEQTELTSALAGYQPLDSDLTAIAALTTTTFGRALLALADAAAGRTALGLGTAATSATSAFDAAGSAAAAQAAAIAASQPVDSDLTAIAALATTTYGRSLLTTADVAALRDALDADDKRPLAFPFSTYQATGGTVTPSGSVLYTLLALSSYAEWTICTFPAGTWRFAINLVTTNGNASSTIQCAVGGSNLGSAISTYDASATPRVVVVDADKTFATRTLAAVRWTTNASGAARCVAWTAWRTA